MSKTKKPTRFDLKDKKDKLKDLIGKDPDFINDPEHGNSMKNLLKSSKKENISDSVIKKVLIMTQEELEETYIKALAKIRKAMGEDEQ
jgi:uncharacterized protein YkwD